MRPAVASALILALGLSLFWPASPGVAQEGAGSRGRSGTAGAAPARRVESSVPFKVGETLSYDVSWTSVLVAGSAVVSVREKKPSFNSTAYYIVAEGRPIPILAKLYSLYYKMDTLIDSYGLLSQRGSLYAEEGSARRTSTTRFDRPANRAFFEEQGDTTTKLDYAVPANTQDGLSALYFLRTRTFKAGERLAISVADSGSLFNLQLTVAGPVPVKFGTGDINAWHLKGFITDGNNQAVWDNVAIWISTDSRRLPVKMQADLPVGAFVLALRSVQ